MGDFFTPVSEEPKTCFARFGDHCRTVLTDSKSHGVRAFHSWAFREKIFKFLVPLSDGIVEIARINGASEEALEGVKNARSAMQAVRDIGALTNVLAGSLPTVVNNVRQIGTLILGLKDGTGEVPAKMGTVAYPAFQPKKYNEFAVGTKEQVLKLISETGSLVGSATYTFGFGVSRPIRNWEKYGIGKVGETAREIGKAFPMLMFANHIGGLVHHTSEMAFQTTAYKRETQGKTNQDELQSALQIYKNKMTTLIIGLVEKLMELFLDIVNLAGWAIPVLARVPIQMAIGTTGLIKAWRAVA